jgi:hypothetical protein
MKKDQTIQIPISIVEENLTTSELGTVLVLMASPYLNWASKQLWQMDKTFSKDLLSLQKQGIVNQDEQGNITVSFGLQTEHEESSGEQPTSQESSGEQSQEK